MCCFKLVRQAKQQVIALRASPRSTCGPSQVFGAWDQVSVLGGIGALPIAVWEFSLGVYLTAKGFRGSVPAPQPDARPHAYS